MRKLLNQAATTVSLEKDLVKELKQMAERFKSVDKQPEEELLDDQSRFILGLWKSMSTLMLIALLQCYKHQPHRNQLDHLVLEDG